MNLRSNYFAATLAALLAQAFLTEKANATGCLELPRPGDLIVYKGGEVKSILNGNYNWPEGKAIYDAATRFFSQNSSNQVIVRTPQSIARDEDILVMKRNDSGVNIIWRSNCPRYFGAKKLQVITLDN